MAAKLKTTLQQFKSSNKELMAVVSRCVRLFAQFPALVLGCSYYRTIAFIVMCVPDLRHDRGHKCRIVASASFVPSAFQAR